MLVHTESPVHLFTTLLQEGLDRMGGHVSDEAVSYVANVLGGSALTNTNLGESVLERFLEANTPVVPRVERISRLREIGDAALVQSGFFWRNICPTYQKRCRSFHVAVVVGGSAYLSLGVDSRMALRERELYGELFERFSLLVQTIMWVSRRVGGETPEDVMHLLRAWQEKQYGFLVAALRDAGILVEHIQGMRAS